MQGNQAIELTDTEIILSVVLDRHFTESNCDGVLCYVGFNYAGITRFDYYICEKCQEIIKL